MTYIAVKTKTGEAVHVALADSPTRTLCGRTARLHLVDCDFLINSRGVQHPWRCDPCNDAVVKRET
jgi:hypothetical protein